MSASPSSLQLRVACFVAAHRDATGTGPVLREITEYFGLGSTASAQYHVRVLTRLELVESDAWKPRSLRATARARRLLGLPTEKEALDRRRAPLERDTTRRCNQCHKPIPEAYPRQNCEDCRRRLRLHRTDRAAFLAERPVRSGLDDEAPLRVHFTPSSGNRKLGRMPAATTTPGTCPTSCGQRGAGCYAEHGFQRYQWSRVAKTGLTWDAFCEEVARVRAPLWRYAAAGDLPGRGDDLDVEKLDQLADAVNRSGRRAFTFTHKPLPTERERESVRRAIRLGFTVNLSADSPAKADELAALGIAPVVTVLPSNAPDQLETAGGRRIVVCLHETHGMTCADCRLCAAPYRSSIVGFRAHGGLAALASERAGGARG